MAIKSVSDFLSKCTSLQKSKKHGDILFFRGVNKIYPKETRHIPGIYYPQDNYIKYEDRIYKEAIAKFPEEMLAQKTTIERLILMQHYRFPTRIMDITKNSLISLFFACFADLGQDSSLKNDGIVYVYQVPEDKIKFCDSDSISIIANLCKRPISFSIKNIYTKDVEAFNENETVEYLVYDIQDDKPQFHNLIQADTINSVFCLNPRMNNTRIIRQDGYFFVFGINMEKKNCAKIEPSWILDEIEIQSTNKTNILDELKDLNIDEAYVYPDFEHVSHAMRIKYGKANNTNKAAIV